jgi:hypothetical protein
MKLRSEIQYEIKQVKRLKEELKQLKEK